MELQLLISKKGTKVVTANQLHRALRLVAHKYNSNVDKWLSDVYAFEDEIRTPTLLKDYAPRNFKYSKLKDYYLSLDLAIRITLNSASPVKQFYAKYLMAMNNDDSRDNAKTTNRTNKSSKHSSVVPALLNRSSALPNGVQLGLW